jgi:hypothetical protein
MKPAAFLRVSPVTLVSPVLAVWLLLGPNRAWASLICGPMLQGATTTNIYVLAECTLDASSPMTVYYGPTAAYGSSAVTSSTKSTTASPVSYVHRIKLTGLMPDTLYHYQLAGQGGTSPDYTFRTLVAPGTAFRWIFAADFRTGTTVHERIADRMLNSNNVPVRPLFDLTGGDYASDNTYANWKAQWLSTNEKELEKWMPVFLSPGNHDSTGSTWGANMQAFDQPPDSSGATGYYSYDCGDLHVTVANYMDPGGYGPGSAQYSWILQDVKSSLKPWKVFVLHAPAYTWGSGSAHPGDANAQAITSNILEPNGAKVFLGGHNHFYQHNLVNGIRHLTVGGGGAPLYPVVTNAATIRTISTNCYLVADLSATNLHMIAYDDFGALLDTIDLNKLPAPANLAAAVGNALVDLAWDPVPGATTYTVLYGTADGGPYPTKQTNTVAGATVTGLSNGTTCYFVVTANDANGPSAVSSQATATPAMPLVVTNIARLADGNFSVAGTGGVGPYILLGATNLTPPVVWSPIATNPATGGSYVLTDLQSTNSARRFYRVQSR